MLARAREHFPEERFPQLRYEKVGLQEMAYRDAFDGLICMDALEHVAPEDWPLIMHNFSRALKPGGHAYFTVEVAPADEVEQAFKRQREMGLPVVYGEWADQNEVYHYYPSMEQVRDWIREAGFDPLEEGEGDGYHHFIIRK
jgi:cyclopropane fatty-acyl-phospholipid synthase-like methyltransferase